jgi:hypothetical protein
VFELHANKYFIVNQSIKSITKTFFFPGPEWLSRIGYKNGTAPTFPVGAAVIRKGGSLFQTLDKNGTAPTFPVGAAFIFCRRTCKPEKTKTF